MNSRERILPILIPTILTDGIYSQVSSYENSAQSDSDLTSSDQLNYQPTPQPTTASSTTPEPTTEPAPTIWDQKTVNKPPTCREVCTAKGQRCGLAQLMPVPLYKCEGFGGSDLYLVEN